MSAASKLTREQALEIRRLYQGDDRESASAGMTTLCARFGVSTSTLQRVLKGKHTAAPGLPDISGRRGAAYGRDAMNEMTQDILAPPSQRLLRNIPAAPSMSSPARRKRTTCPVCAARPGEPCWSRGAYVKALRNMHPERKVNIEGEK